LLQITEIDVSERRDSTFTGRRSLDDRHPTAAVQEIPPPGTTQADDAIPVPYMVLKMTLVRKEEPLAATGDPCG